MVALTVMTALSALTTTAAAWLLLQADPVAEARRLAAQGELEQALEILDDARESAPTAPLLAFIAELRTANDQIPQATEALEEALVLAPDQNRWRTTLGALYFRLRSFSEAQRELERALEQAPENAVAHYYLGAVLLGEGRFEEALRSAERAVALMPATPPDLDRMEFSLAVNALHLLAEIQYQRGHEREAERLLRKVLEEEPSHPEAHYLLGRTLAKAGRREEAADELRLFRRAKKAAEHIELGLNFSRHAGRLEPAVAELRLALEVYPLHPRALYLLGFLLLRQGHRQEAEELFRKLIEIRPEAAANVRRLGER